MRILLISYYFPPTGGPGALRWANLLKHFPEDYYIDIITVKNSNHPVSDSKLLDILPETCNIFYCDSPEKILNKKGSEYLRIGKSHNIFLPDSKFWWARKARNLINGKNYDLIISTSPPFTSVVAARQISESMNIPFIADMRDSYLLDPNPPKPGGLFYKLKRRIFLKNIRAASAIVAVNKTVQKEMRYRNLYRVPVEYIPNGIVEMPMVPSNEIFTIAVAGRFFANLNFPDNLFKAMRILKDELFSFKMRFLGPADPLYGEMAIKYDIFDNIEITGSLPHEQIIQELARSDLLFTFLDDRPGNSRQVQSKIWDYIGTTRPIIAIVPFLSPGAEIIREYEAGIIVKDDHQNIAEAIKNAGIYKRNIPIGISWEDRANQYLELIQRISREL